MSNNQPTGRAAFMDAMSRSDQSFSAQELISLLEEAKGPDRNIDRHIYFLVLPVARECWPHWTTLQRDQICPRYTESIDAALTLVAEGDCWLIAYGGFARITRGELNEEQQVWSASLKAGPAIALCIAAMKARSAT